jgi:urease accessory protein
MMMAEPIRHQRSEGEVLLSMGAHGLKRMREAHAAKVRMPQGSHEAILINTGGGLAGGDRFTFTITAEENARLTVTSQAAERVYRSLGPAADVDVRLTADAGATLMWLPQETILFDGAALNRRITADLAADAQLLAVESVILGREASGETVRHAACMTAGASAGGPLLFADDLAFDGAPPGSGLATLGDARAFATIVLVSPRAEDIVDKARTLIGANGSASAWAGKLVARLAARDGFELRKSLIPALTLLADGALLCPKLGHSEEKPCS